MRIIIDARTTQNEWKSNGIGFYARNIIINMVNQFQDTKFVLLMYESPSEIDRMLDTKPSNVEVVRMDEFRGKNLFNPTWYLEQVFPGIDMLSALKRVYKVGDIFFSPFFWGGLPINIPFVVAIHDFALPKLRAYSQISIFHNIARGFTYWKEMLKTLNAKSIVFGSEHALNDYISYFPSSSIDRLHTIHLGLDIEEVRSDVSHLLPRDWKKRGYIINIGTGYSKNKNVASIIRGYAKYLEGLGVENRVTAPYLVIAGKDFENLDVKDVRGLHSLIDDLGIKGYVHFSGRYEDSERFSLLTNSLLAINLSLYEGFGFALLEGMKVGTPTISSNASCYPEVAKDGALFVDGTDVKEVSKAINKLISDREYALQLGKKGRKVASSYDWKSTASKTYNILVNCMNNR